MGEEENEEVMSTVKVSFDLLAHRRLVDPPLTCFPSPFVFSSVFLFFPLDSSHSKLEHVSVYFSSISCASAVFLSFSICFPVGFNQSKFEYLYLTEADYAKVSKSVIADRIEYPPPPSSSSSSSPSSSSSSSSSAAKEVRYVIRDVIGVANGLGVENLSGSGE